MIETIQNPTTYYKSSRFEFIYQKHALPSYPMHTHAAHWVYGWVHSGSVQVYSGGQERVYTAGGQFCIAPDTPHAVQPAGTQGCSLLVLCLPANPPAEGRNQEAQLLNKLKQRIQTAPEQAFSIEEMAQYTGYSPFHMIRRFRSACGLTPHQFQIQCRVRKAQQLLESGTGVAAAASAAGFCDQSHFDRCFQKIVRLTPRAYQQSVQPVSTMPEEILQTDRAHRLWQ